MSAKFKDKVLDFLGFGPEEDYDEYEDDEVSVAETRASERTSERSYERSSAPERAPERPVERQSGISRKGNVLSIHSSNAAAPMKVVLSEPSDFDDVKDICDELKNKKPVIVNFENVDTNLAQRMVDFISGAVYALDGSIQKVSRGIIIIAPQNVDILGSIKSSIGNDIYEMEGIFGWLK